MKAERAGRGAVIGGLSFGVPIVFLYPSYIISYSVNSLLFDDCFL